MLPIEKDLPNIHKSDPIPKKKKRVDSKAKGKSFEGEIAKILSKELAPYQFKRVLHSGAILGGKNAVNMDQYSQALANLFIGDVVCINDSEWDSKFRFSIECKFYKTPEGLDNFLGVVNSNIPKWYEEAVVDAKKVNKTPLLIVKYNRSSIYCIISDDYSLAPLEHYVHLRKEKLKIFLLSDVIKYKDLWTIEKDIPNESKSS